MPETQQSLPNSKIEYEITSHECEAELSQLSESLEVTKLELEAENARAQHPENISDDIVKDLYFQAIKLPEDQQEKVISKLTQLFPGQAHAQHALRILESKKDLDLTAIDGISYIPYLKEFNADKAPEPDLITFVQKAQSISSFIYNNNGKIPLDQAQSYMQDVQKNFSAIENLNVSPKSKKALRDYLMEHTVNKEYQDPEGFISNNDATSVPFAKIIKKEEIPLPKFEVLKILYGESIDHLSMPVSVINELDFKSSGQRRPNGEVVLNIAQGFDEFSSVNLENHDLVLSNEGSHVAFENLIKDLPEEGYLSFQEWLINRYGCEADLHSIDEFLSDITSVNTRSRDLNRIHYNGLGNETISGYKFSQDFLVKNIAKIAPELANQSLVSGVPFTDFLTQDQILTFMDAYLNEGQKIVGKIKELKALSPPPTSTPNSLSQNDHKPRFG